MDVYAAQALNHLSEINYLYNIMVELCYTKLHYIVIKDMIDCVNIPHREY